MTMHSFGWSILIGLLMLASFLFGQRLQEKETSAKWAETCVKKGVAEFKIVDPLSGEAKFFWKLPAPQPLREGRTVYSDKQP